MALSFRAKSRNPLALLSGNISGSFDFAALRSGRHFERPQLLSSAHFQLFSQDPVQRDKQYECGYDQHHGVESKHAERDSEIAFLETEEHVRLIAAAVVVLLHLAP